MSEAIFRTAKGMERVQRSWLRQPIEKCCDELVGRGYKFSGVRVCASLWLAFGEFVAAQGDCQLTHLPTWVEPFLAQRYGSVSNARIGRSTIRALVRYLVQTGAVPPLPPAHTQSPHPHVELLDEYGRFLREHRGICLPHMQNTLRCCQALLAHLGTSGSADLVSARPETIHEFLILQGQHFQRTTMKSRCGMVRGFLGWLHRRGVIPRDLSSVIVSPRVFKHEACPRYLTRSQIEAVISVIDLQTPVGRRDCAMVLLLAVYGLRGGEVRRLRLDDIDWARQLLHVRKRKAGNFTTYPLAAPVAQAIIAYLQHGRPVSGCREVFLASRMPFAPLRYTINLSRQVQKYLRLAGIKVDRAGTHTFRYSCAQRLLDQGTPLKAIGDYLGHASLDSTMRYTKIAVEQLRTVACGAGEDVL